MTTTEFCQGVTPHDGTRNTTPTGGATGSGGVATTMTTTTLPHGRPDSLAGKGVGPTGPTGHTQPTEPKDARGARGATGATGATGKSGHAHTSSGSAPSPSKADAES